MSYWKNPPRSGVSKNDRHSNFRCNLRGGFDYWRNNRRDWSALMKVAELEGTHLDYWVARAEGRDTRNWGVVPRDAWYSSRWELAGPIIERARIGFFVTAGLADGMQYAASCDRHVLTSIYGPTPLIAAMRAYVVSVFGDEVPDLDA